MINRRGLLLGLASALAAPAIVHAHNLMAVKPTPIAETMPVEFQGWEFVDPNGVRTGIIRVRYKIVHVPQNVEWQPLQP